MNNADLERYNAAKSTLRVLIDHAVKAQTMSQKELLTRANEIIARIFDHNKQTPKHLGTTLHAYFDGYLCAAMKDKTVFLYKVDGQFYKLGNSTQKHLDFPEWSELPRERWDSLGDFGGSFWADSLIRFF